MTEEIIIDCAFYKDGVCASPINKTCEYCKNIDVSKCYHKQLKRLEQENKELKEKYSHILELAKTNADSNEYCLQELEKENEELRSALEEIREIVKPYLTDCQGSLCEPIDEVLNKINEVFNDSK